MTDSDSFVSRILEFFFATSIFHVGLESADLSVARVSERVKEGGHAVPEGKIRARFERSGPLIHEAMRVVDIGYVYDNSLLNLPHQHLMTFEQGKVVKLNSHLPTWAKCIYTEDIKSCQALPK